MLTIKGTIFCDVSLYFPVEFYLFRRNFLPLSSGLNSKPSDLAASIKQEGERAAEELLVQILAVMEPR
jgi:hypothetical protein